MLKIARYQACSLWNSTESVYLELSLGVDALASAPSHDIKYFILWIYRLYIMLFLLVNLWYKGNLRFTIPCMNKLTENESNYETLSISLIPVPYIIHTFLIPFPRLVWPPTALPGFLCPWTLPDLTRIQSPRLSRGWEQMESGHEEKSKLILLISVINGKAASMLIYVLAVFRPERIEWTLI